MLKRVIREKERECGYMVQFPFEYLLLLLLVLLLLVLVLFLYVERVLYARNGNNFVHPFLLRELILKVTFFTCENIYSAGWLQKNGALH